MNYFEEYAILNAKIAELEAQQAILKTKIIEEMVEKGEKKVVVSVGQFSISQRKTWTYSENVEKKNEELKAEKAKEESCGIATFIETPSLRFTGVNL